MLLLALDLLVHRLAPLDLEGTSSQGWGTGRGVLWKEMAGAAAITPFHGLPLRLFDNLRTVPHPQNSEAAHFDVFDLIDSFAKSVFHHVFSSTPADDWRVECRLRVHGV